MLLGANEGANPVEFLLHVLAGCVTTTTVLHAAARGIRIRSLRTELAGHIDPQGFLGLDGNVPAGYQQIRSAWISMPTAAMPNWTICWPFRRRILPSQYDVPSGAGGDRTRAPIETTLKAVADLSGDRLWAADAGDCSTS